MSISTMLKKLFHTAATKKPQDVTPAKPAVSEPLTNDNTIDWTAIDSVVEDSYKLWVQGEQERKQQEAQPQVVKLIPLPTPAIISSTEKLKQFQQTRLRQRINS